VDGLFLMFGRCVVVTGHELKLMCHGLWIVDYGICIGRGVQIAPPSHLFSIFCCIVCYYCGNGLVFVATCICTLCSHTIRYPISFFLKRLTALFVLWTSFSFSGNLLSHKRPASILNMLSLLEYGLDQSHNADKRFALSSHYFTINCGA
jgi:hypothetical protein